MPFGAYTLSRLQTLQPPVRPIAQSFLEQAEAAGIPLEMVQGTRTFAQQQTVYDQGRTAPGAIVTNAAPGDSFHQYGLAFDVVPVAYKNLKDWNPSGPLWGRIGTIGESLGLTWGGRWSDPDKPHFHLAAAPLAELKAYWEKFKQVMPVEVTPSMGVGAAIVLIFVLGFFLKQQLERRGML